MTEARQTPAPISARSARTVLIVLTFVNLFNYIDRWIVPALGDTLRQALRLSDTKFGLLATGFIVVYALTSPRFGALGDTRQRPRLIALGVAIWSVATALGGFAVGFVTMLIARSLVGVGEAAYGSIAPSLLADSFPRERRGRIFAIFFAAIPIGSALGYLIGAAMLHFGWRPAFFVVGVPGILLAALLLRLPEAPRGAHDPDDFVGHAPAAHGDGARWPVYRGLLANRQYVVTVLGYAAYTFVIGAMAWWMPTFLQRTHGIPLASADRITGIVALATGFAGTLAGGWIGDRALRVTPHAYLLVSGIATLLAVPFATLALTAGSMSATIVGLVLAEALLFVSTGPVNSAIVNYVAPTQRATAMATSILVMHLLGDAPSPWIVGWISGRFKDAGVPVTGALQHALWFLPGVILLSGLIWTFGALRPARTPSAP